MPDRPLAPSPWMKRSHNRVSKFSAVKAKPPAVNSTRLGTTTHFLENRSATRLSSGTKTRAGRE